MKISFDGKTFEAEFIYLELDNGRELMLNEVDSGVVSIETGTLENDDSLRIDPLYMNQILVTPR